ncbi:MAG: hypothetical protein LBU87_06840 [Lactobacillales bacterium]|nr:hypothetical protein [Lactobacillales bacterium]
MAGVAAFSTNAMALELTNPFYGPDKGQLTSTTAYTYERTSRKNEAGVLREYDNVIAEELRYGIIDNLTIDATVSNTWQRFNSSGYTDKDDTNIDWSLGATYNFFPINCPTKVQASAKYGQKPSWSHVNNGEYKYARAQVKAGYDFGIVLPYLTADVEFPLWQGEEAAHRQNRYETRLGFYKMFGDKFSADLGVQFNYEKSESIRNWSTTNTVSYYITPNWAVSAYGKITIDSQGSDDFRGHEKALGLRLRTTF